MESNGTRWSHGKKMRQSHLANPVWQIQHVQSCRRVSQSRGHTTSRLDHGQGRGEQSLHPNKNCFPPAGQGSSHAGRLDKLDPSKMTHCLEMLNKPAVLVDVFVGQHKASLLPLTSLFQLHILRAVESVVTTLLPCRPDFVHL